MTKWKIKGTLKELLSAPQINMPLKIYQYNWDEPARYFLVQGVLPDHAYGYLYTGEKRTYYEEPLNSKTIWFTQDIPLSAVSYCFWDDAKNNQVETIADFYNIDPQNYIYTKVEEVGFSYRLTNCLLQSKIETISELLNISFEDLAEIKNLGHKSIGEVKDFFEKVKLESDQLCNYFPKDSSKLTISNSIIYDKASFISNGDFSFVEDIHLNGQEINIIEKYRSSISTIGEDFAKKCLAEPRTVKKIILGFSDYILNTKKYRTSKDLERLIPHGILKKQVRGYILAYTSNIKIQKSLMEFWGSPIDTIDFILKTEKSLEEKEFILLQSFFDWCSFDITKDMNQICAKIFDDQRVQTIADLRANGETLEYIGAHLGLSRERIRQIEKDVKQKFKNLDARHKLILKIKATEEIQTVDQNALSKYAGSYTSALLHLMKK